ncbi:transferrin-binding protein-like solute binding protein [Novosphingobium sp.]|uniref:transferrin-binding protein-like solute binding protein n=1 Tax=Novosphingobium sp. TaxID=1874826 RepID=UPI003D0D9222
MPTNGTAGTTSVGSSTLSVSYDAKSKDYTISVVGRSQTFTPGDINASKSSSSGATVYIKTSGSTTDSLTLTNAGTSGALTYEYVGAGFWQRTVQGEGTVSGSLDAFTYGVTTAASAVPLKGAGTYNLDLLAIEGTPYSVTPIAGQGSANVDFATGVIQINGVLLNSVHANTSFYSLSQISGNQNSFVGNFQLSDFQTYNGTLAGRFYGPVAQEMGATFSAADGASDVIVGTLTGRGSVSTTGVQEYDAGTSVRQSYTSTALTDSTGAATGQHDISGQTVTPVPIVVEYDSGTGTYAALAPADLLPRASSGLAVPATTLVYLNPDYQFVAGGQRSQVVSTSGGASAITNDFFVFGNPTALGGVPRTGTAGYALNVQGIVGDTNFKNLLNFNGTGTLTADFSAGTLTAGSAVSYLPTGSLSPTAVATGNFAATGTISATANALTGTVTLDGLGSAYSGPLNGQFYGPGAQELGAAFSASSASGTASGFFTAQNTNPAGSLATLQTATSFDVNASQASQACNCLIPQSTRGSSVVSFNPTYPEANIYALSEVSVYSSGSEINFVVGRPGQPFLSNLEFNESSGSLQQLANAFGTGYTAAYDLKLFNPTPSNPVLVLTYTSFADLTTTETFQGQTYVGRYFIPFGIETTPSQMPTTGSANYSGIVYGEGSLNGGSYNNTLSGTSMLSANFATGAITATANITATDTDTNVATTFSPVTLSGAISGNSFNVATAAPASAKNLGGVAAGNFYGPAANEFGAAFALSQTGVAALNGVLVGKKN